MKHQANAIELHNTADKLETIKKDTLIIAGKKDNLIPFRHSKKLHRAIPNSVLILYEDAGHGFWIEKPEFTVNTLLDFL